MSLPCYSSGSHSSRPQRLNFSRFSDKLASDASRSVWFHGTSVNQSMMSRESLCFRYISGQLVLVRQDQLNQTDAVRIVDPPGDLVAQPVKPERLKFIKRFLIYEQKHGLLKVIPEAPNRSQNSGKPSLHPHAQENRRRKEGFKPSEEGRKTSQTNTHFSGQES